MDINELEKELRSAADTYRDHIHMEVDTYKELSANEKEVYLLEMIEEMHRQNYYALLGMQEGIIKYLKENR